MRLSRTASIIIASLFASDGADIIQKVQHHSSLNPDEQKMVFSLGSLDSLLNNVSSLSKLKKK
jgi:hypothetical protein